MSEDFTDHVAVVTGAGSGIGAAIAEGFARAGARVVLVDLSATALDQQLARMSTWADPARLDARVLDITATDDVDAMLESVGSVSGIDHVVNCAASFINAGVAAT